MMWICIGSGSSMKGFDFRCLDQFETIGCNRVFLAYPEVKRMVFIDRMLYDEFSKELSEYKGLIYANRKAVPDDFEHPGLKRIDVRYRCGECRGETHMGYLSGLTAIDIACREGATDIFLLGYDLYPGHFYEVDDPLYNERRVVAANIRGDWLRQKYKDVRIFNCNEDSLLESFEYI